MTSQGMYSIHCDECIRLYRMHRNKSEQIRLKWAKKAHFFRFVRFGPIIIGQIWSDYNRTNRKKIAKLHNFSMFSNRMHHFPICPIIIGPNRTNRKKWPFLALLSPILCIRLYRMHNFPIWSDLNRTNRKLCFD